MRYPHPSRQLLAPGLFLALSIAFAQAGTVVSLKDNSESSGKLSLTPGALHIDTGATPVDVPLDTVLEAGFSDQPFHIDSFSSALSPNELPISWKAQDIGQHPKAKDGSFTYANGVLTITGSGYDYQRGGKEDQMFIAGQMWTGSGQLTGRMKEVQPNPGGPSAGPMIRTNADSLSSMLFMSMHGGDGGGLFVGRGNQGDHVGWTGFAAGFPTWFRLTWNGTSLDSEVSSDGRKWDTVGQNGFKSTDGIWIGLAVNSGREDALGSAIFDQILMTPFAAEPETLPNGTLLVDGTFLFGGPDFINQNQGQIGHAGKGCQVLLKQVAAIIAHPLTAQQRTNNLNSLPGLLFKNGDFMQADLDNVQGSGFYQITSIALGASTYYGDTVRAYIMQPVKSVPAKYEIRLHDGSIIQTRDFVADGAQLALTDALGLVIHIDPAEVAQFRAGSAIVQDLISLPWKTSPNGGEAKAPDANKPDEKKSPAPEKTPVTNAAPAGTPPATPATNAAPAAAPPAAPAAPAADTAPPPDANSFAAPPVPASETWQGPGQEQIIVLTAGNKIDFPLRDKFRALSMRVALSPDSPSGAQAGLHIIVDGKDAGGMPPLKRGDAPQRISLNFPSPKTLTVSVESSSPGARVLLIDPVAIRDMPLPTPAPAPPPPAK